VAKPSLLEGPIRPHLVRLGLPMAIGIALIVATNLTDTFFVSRLGEAELTAMSFTFPIEGLVLSIAMGLSVGATATIARAIGSGDSELAARLTTHACGLAMLVVAAVSLGGLATQDQLARALGAPDAVAALLQDYMTVWYAGAVFLVVPLVGNGAMRADGDATTPMWIMAGAALANLALDPVLIFGLGPIPALGMRGAAIATVLARAFVLVVTLVILRRRGRLDLHLPSMTELWSSWRRILAVGVPAAVSNALPPIATSLLTAIIARFGPDAVAAFGVASRVEGLVLIPALALGAAMTPFVGQNWGGHQELRVGQGLLLARRFVILWGLGAWVVVGLLGRHIGRVFSDHPETLDHLELYLWIVPAAYGAQGVVGVISSVFNAIDRAVRATLLSAIRSVVLAVPLATLGAYLGGTAGVFFGLALTSFAAGILASVWARNIFRPIRALAEVRSAEELTAASDDVRARVELLLDEVTERGELIAAARPINTIGFFHQGGEIGHVHRRGIIDLHVPPALHDALVADGLAEAHRHRAEDQSWVSRRLTTDDDAREAAWMLGLLAALRDFRTGRIDRGRLLELAHENEPSDRLHTGLERALVSIEPQAKEEP
jgi:putative MATE family efflux protein